MTKQKTYMDKSHGKTVKERTSTYNGSKSIQIIRKNTINTSKLKEKYTRQEEECTRYRIKNIVRR